MVTHKPQAAVVESDLLIARSEPGICRVVCFSPRHDLAIPRLSMAELKAVVEGRRGQHNALQKIEWVRHIQIFENRGALMGASNPHPHGQLWANASIPNIPQKEL